MIINDVIEKYINDHLLKGLHYGGIQPRIWCIDSEIIFMYNGSFGMSILYVSLSTWHNLCCMFSLTENDANSIFKTWATRTLGLPEKMSVSPGFF